ncbi:hypothetical protein [Mycoplasma parvum]|uniref:hypothetical protein n=1 Tax=Mycoplasma parvum TaxID=984991 RepID=UPI0011826D5C|nr:hypothetical protein [Mycoplasma parvum]
MHCRFCGCFGVNCPHCCACNGFSCHCFGGGIGCHRGVCCGAGSICHDACSRSCCSDCSLSSCGCSDSCCGSKKDCCSESCSCDKETKVI